MSWTIDDPPLDDVALQLKVAALREKSCGECGRSICGHEILFSIALGMSDSPLCVCCLAASVNRDPRDLSEHLREHFLHRECYGIAWRLENVRERFDADARPACLWPDGTAPAETISVAEPSSAGESWSADETWDAGDLSCGDLVLALRNRLRTSAPGTRLLLIARDRGATEDLPAWCRLTGHGLVSCDPPRFLIQRREN